MQGARSRERTRSARRAATAPVAHLVVGFEDRTRTRARARCRTSSEGSARSDAARAVQRATRSSAGKGRDVIDRPGQRVRTRKRRGRVRTVKRKHRRSATVRCPCDTQRCRGRDERQPAGALRLLNVGYGNLVATGRIVRSPRRSPHRCAACATRRPDAASSSMRRKAAARFDPRHRQRSRDPVGRSIPRRSPRDSPDDPSPGAGAWIDAAAQRRRGFRSSCRRPNWQDDGLSSGGGGRCGHRAVGVAYDARCGAPERDGSDYHFVPVERFRKLVAEGAFLEYAQYGTNLYGTVLVRARGAARAWPRRVARDRDPGRAAGARATGRGLSRLPAATVARRTRAPATRTRHRRRADDPAPADDRATGNRRCPFTTTRIINDDLERAVSAVAVVIAGERRGEMTELTAPLRARSSARKRLLAQERSGEG